MKLRWMTITLAVLSAFAPGSLWAFGEKCGPVFASEYAKLGQIEVKPSGQKGPPANDYARTVDKIHSLMGDLAIPHEVQIQIDSAFIFSTFNAESYQISVGVRPDKMGKKHPAINQNTLMHEYAHAVFEKNMTLRSPGYKTLREEQISLHAREDNLHATNDALMAEQAKATDPAVRQELDKKIYEIIKEIDAVAERRKELSAHWSLRSAVHELFADSLSMVVTKDPKSMSSVLKSAGENYRPHSSTVLQFRDFTEGRHHLSRQRWKKEYPFYSQFGGDLYYAFLPARWELWQIVKTRIGGDNYQRTVIPKVFAILEKHLSLELNKGPEELKPRGFKDLEALNQRIIEDFRREL
ncbi:hypothetical protein Bb109J_c3583 [Bdellovibrio bacteriovorus]|uniref:hypothetical protein n=1 Tax=Bdellovibrio bacteriovorus TaxID=959 RepID=UPI00045C16B2|nr:hypothetical protein [Bdellovibrio bacteriovorus]AHZ85617.1 hypothetical protein EP01_11820 [Bdellovibrio bacteriovorus]BEV70163.1 hypothetical protein Bb109J_c3583 [Bdellovibrio bacteriovorus]